jgi:uncharacterized membrane protein
MQVFAAVFVIFAILAGFGLKAAGYTVIPTVLWIVFSSIAILLLIYPSKRTLKKLFAKLSHRQANAQVFISS